MSGDEEWRTVVGYPTYEVSSLGNVRNRRGHILKPYKHLGYPGVALWRDGSQRTRAIHRLVCETFHGPAPDGQEVRHLNGRRDDNRTINLAWGTQKENAADRRLHGTNAAGLKNGRAKLTDSDVLEIRAARKVYGWRFPSRVITDLTDRYGISQSTLRKVCTRTWKHLD